MNIPGLILSILFLLSALFHGLALHWPIISAVPEGPETHAFFAIVNLWMGNRVLTARTSYDWGQAGGALILLSIHQLIVHGGLLVVGLLHHRNEVGQIVQNALVVAGVAASWVLMRFAAKDT